MARLWWRLCRATGHAPQRVAAGLLAVAREARWRLAAWRVRRG